MEKHVHLLLSSDVRLHLKLLSAIHSKTMGQMISQLIDEAYNRDEMLITRKHKSKIKRLVKRWS